MNREINIISLFRTKKLKNIFFRTKSPEMKSDFIEKKLNEQKNIYKTENLINKKNTAKIKLDKNKNIIIKKNYKDKKASKKKINIKTINNNKHKIRKTKKEEEKKINLIKNEKEQRIEDISDYININVSQKIINYNYFGNKITNEAIEEVEEVKELSILTQPSELIYHGSNSKSSIKNSVIKSNKPDYIKKKFYRIKSKNKSNKLSLKKSSNENIDFSSPLKRIEFGHTERNSFYNSYRKKNFKTNYIVAKNCDSKKKKKLMSAKKDGSNCLIKEKNMKKIPKQKIKKIPIIKRINIFDLKKINNNNKSNINVKNIIDIRDILKNGNRNENYIINCCYISKTSRNKKIIVKKKDTKRKKNLTEIQYEINFKRENSKQNRHKNQILFYDKEKKIKRKRDINNNNYFCFDKLKSAIKNIKKSKEKYHKLFTDSYLTETERNKGKFINTSLTGKRK